MEIWFWQLIVSPHMAGLARELAAKGCKVVYAAHQEMSPSRASQGWKPPFLGEARLELVPNKKAVEALVEAANPNAIHICQGIRGNGIVSEVQKILAKYKRKQWVVMETVDDFGWQGAIKRLEYRRLFRRINPYLEGVLAIGDNTRDWVIARGIQQQKVFPFAYFLPDDTYRETKFSLADNEGFRVLFVGQFIERKRLDLLIAAMADLGSPSTELAIIGSGPLGQSLKKSANYLLSGRVDWIGQLPMEKVHQQMAQADCLVLPSRHDGWGAVVSEALMVGTPAICSGSCGSAGVVRASGVGGVFQSGSQDDLRDLLTELIMEGKPSIEARTSLARWATSLGAARGGEYLLSVLGSRNSKGGAPFPPWVQ